MNKIFLALIFFSSLCINAQVYEFDSMTIYSSKFEQNESKKMIYINSKNDSYYLQLFFYSDLNEAKLYDIKNRKIHYFGVNEVKTKDGISISFDYQRTSNLSSNGENSLTKYIYDFDTFEINNKSKKVNLIVYKNSKRKKIILNIELELNENDSNLFHAYRISCIHPYESVTKFNLNENYIVTSAKVNTLSKNKIEHKLLEYKQVNFAIQIP